MSLKNLLKTLLILAISSCASIKIPDEEVCGQIAQKHGYCARIVSSATRDVYGTEWDQMVRRGLIIQPEAYGRLKAMLLSLCKKSKKCNIQEVEKKIELAESKLN